jgi:hypothetical protein
MGYGLRIWNLGFRIQGLGYGSRVKGLESVGFVELRDRVQDSRFKVYGLEFKGVGFGV